MHEDEPVGGFVVEREFRLVDQHAGSETLLGPGNGAELGRHQRATGPRLGPERRKIRRGEAEPEHAHVLEVAEPRPDARAKQPAHDDAQAGRRKNP